MLALPAPSRLRQFFYVNVFEVEIVRHTVLIGVVLQFDGPRAGSGWFGCQRLSSGTWSATSLPFSFTVTLSPIMVT